MAAATGITASTLSKVERGQLSLTYDKLFQLVQALGIDVAELFSTTSAKPITARCVLDRKGQSTVVETHRYRYEFPAASLRERLLIPVMVEPLSQTLEEFGELSRHHGEEFIHVLTGPVLFLSEYYEPMTLQSGDCLYYDGNMGHAFLAVKGKAAKVLSVGSSPDILRQLGLSSQQHPDATADLRSLRKRAKGPNTLSPGRARARRRRGSQAQ